MSSGTTSSASRRHLSFLDGMRGIAAAYVVFGHVHRIAVDRPGIAQPALVQRSVQWLAYGQVAVSVFIVLSGYCLMLPVANDPARRLPGGLGRYVYRRARRILPPFYFALALSLMLGAAFQLKGEMAASWGSFFSHLLVAHNVRPEWSHSIDPPMWSVATEWQIYFVFAMVLLPVWRMCGNLITLALALLLGCLPRILWPAYSFDWAHPWYVFLFAMGMTAAVVTETDETGAAGVWITRRAAVTAGVLLVVLGATYAIKARLGDWLFVAADSIEGLIAALLIICCATSLAVGGRRPVMLWVFDSRVAVWLGAFSYSLYLVHFPVLATIDSLLRGRVSELTELTVMLTAGVAVATIVSYLFYLACERPFLTSSRRKANDRVIAAPQASVMTGQPTIGYALDAALQPAVVGK
jgi:peptidoglycan/LPS O-acetylase OafA/YrhL